MIAQVIGLSDRDLNDASCTRNVSPLGAVNARGLLSCLPAADSASRLAAAGTFWLIFADTADQILGGQRSWRRTAPAVAVLRDSIARALNGRGLHHLSCPDSVQHPREGRTHWLSVWQGDAYNVLLFHVQAASDTLQLTIQASPGLGQRCYVSS